MMFAYILSDVLGFMFSIFLSFTQVVELYTFDGEGKAVQRVQI
jgi:hypothetical protein